MAGYYAKRVVAVLILYIFRAAILRIHYLLRTCCTVFLKSYRQRQLGCFLFGHLPDSLQTWIHPPRICKHVHQSSKKKNAITPQHPRVSPVEPPWFAQNSFTNMYVYVGCIAVLLSELCN